MGKQPRNKHAEIEVKNFSGRPYGIKEFEVEDDLEKALALTIKKCSSLSSVKSKLKEVEKDLKKDYE